MQRTFLPPTDENGRHEGEGGRVDGGTERREGQRTVEQPCRFSTLSWKDPGPLSRLKWQERVKKVVGGAM